MGKYLVSYEVLRGFMHQFLLGRYVLAHTRTHDIMFVTMQNDNIHTVLCIGQGP